MRKTPSAPEIPSTHELEEFCNELPNWAKQKLPAIDLQQPGLNTKTLQRLICEKMTQKELDDALFAEAKAGRDTWLAQLHAQGGDATIKHLNELGGKETPIHIACRLGHRAVVETIAAWGPSKSAVNTLCTVDPDKGYRTYQGWYPIQSSTISSAANHRHPELFATLLQHGAHADFFAGFYEQQEIHPVDYCAIYNHPTVLADILPHYPGAKAIMQTPFGETALHFAARFGRTEVLKTLLSHLPRPLPEISFNHYGNSAIMEAAQHGHTDCIRELVSAGSDINFQFKIPAGRELANPYQHNHRGSAHVRVNADGHTALMRAARNSQHEAVKTLLDLKADPSLTNNDNDSALSLAAEKGDSATVKLLLADTRLDITGQIGARAMQYAMDNSRIDCVRLLKQHGAPLPKLDYQTLKRKARFPSRASHKLYLYSHFEPNQGNRFTNTRLFKKFGPKNTYEHIQSKKHYWQLDGLPKKRPTLESAVVAGDLEDVQVLLAIGEGERIGLDAVRSVLEQCKNPDIAACLQEEIQYLTPVTGTVIDTVSSEDRYEAKDELPTPSPQEVKEQTALTDGKAIPTPAATIVISPTATAVASQSVRQPGADEAIGAGAGAGAGAAWVYDTATSQNPQGLFGNKNPTAAATATSLTEQPEVLARALPSVDILSAPDAPTGSIANTVAAAAGNGAGCAAGEPSLAAMTAGM